MPTRDAELQFRQALIVRLSASDFARQIARRGWQDADAVQAQSLGVSSQTLAAAVRLAQLNWPIPESVRQDLFIPRELRPALARVFKRANLGPGHYIRALCHAVLQTTCEPSPRRRIWTEPPRRADKRVPAPYFRVSTRFNLALSTALDLRSAALHLTRHGYILRWIADLSEGRLRDLPVPVTPVSLDQLYADERAYVLPAGNYDQAKRRRVDARAGTTGRAGARARSTVGDQPLAAARDDGAGSTAAVDAGADPQAP